MKEGRLYVISGASGAGKNTVINKAIEVRPDLFYSISATTRAPREGEVDGINYYFLSKEKFVSMIDENEFLEHARYVNNYYGTPAKPIREKLQAGIDVILDIEVQGAMQVKAAMPEAILVFVLPPEFSELEKRIRARCVIGEEDIGNRLKTAREEYTWADKYDYIIINDTPENAVDELLTIMKAESCRVRYRKHYTVIE